MPLNWPTRGEHRNNPWDIFVRRFLEVSHEGDGTLKQSVVDGIRSGLAVDPHNHDDLYYTETEVTATIDVVYDRIELGHSDILYPVGFQAGDTATETPAAVSGITVAQYLGRAPRAITSLIMRANVTTAAATITWAEVAVFTGDYPGAAGASLTLAGFADVASTFNSTGRKSTTIALSGVESGEEIWLAWGSSATTPFRLRAGLADDLHVGVNQAASVRPSLASSPQAFISATSDPAWLAALI